MTHVEMPTIPRNEPVHALSDVTSNISSLWQRLLWPIMSSLLLLDKKGTICDLEAQKQDCSNRAADRGTHMNIG